MQGFSEAVQPARPNDLSTPPEADSTMSSRKGSIVDCRKPTEISVKPANIPAPVVTLVDRPKRSCKQPDRLNYKDLGG